jgi:hypothetical protein
MGSAENTEQTPDPDREHAWWTWWRGHGQAHLTLVLREEWNPIGSEDVPASEYSSYATRIGGLLREGVSEDEIAAYLSDTRMGALGLPARPDEDRRVAATVHAWYLAARRATE